MSDLPTDVQQATDVGPAAAPRSSWTTPRIIAIVIGVLTIGLVGVLATRQTASQRSTVSPLIGRVAPEITGDDIRGSGRVQLSSYSGKWVVLNFFATWCPPCLREHPEFVEFSKRHSDVALLSVINEDTKENVAKFFDERGGTWPVLDSERSAVDYGITGLPESYLIAPDGRVAMWFKGALTADRLNATLAEAQRVWSGGTVTTVAAP